MDVIRWRNGIPADPFREFESLQDEINRLFDLVRVPEARGIFEGAFSPAVDVVETADGYEVLCDVPGVEMGDLQISMAGSVLTLKGEKKTGGDGRGGRAYREEAHEGRFQRTLQLPAPVDPDKVEAVLADGVLKMTLPKHEAARPHQIAVKAK
jgi:HSP20 family protein